MKTYWVIKIGAVYYRDSLVSMRSLVAYDPWLVSRRNDAHKFSRLEAARLCASILRDSGDVAIVYRITKRCK